MLEQLDAIRGEDPAVPTEGIDPDRVFKVRSASRLADSDMTRRELVPLGETTDWVYFVLPVDGGEELERALRVYVAEATAAEDKTAGSHGESGSTVPLSGFIDQIEGIERYGREDRLTPSLAEMLDAGVVPDTIDVLIWPSIDRDQARQRLASVDAVVSQFGGSVRGHDEAASTTAARVSCDRATLEILLELSAVASVRLPLTPQMEPSSWLGATLADLRVPTPLDAVVGIVDDGIAANHPLLDGLVIGERSFPSQHNWRGIGPHGTLVAGLAAYGGFDDEDGNGELRLSSPVRVVAARVLEPDADAASRGTRFPSDVPDHRTVAEAIRWLHDEHGVKVVNLSITDSRPYMGPNASLWTATLDSLVRELDIVIVVAAGNTQFGRNGETADGSHVMRDYPSYLTADDHRLAEPATAASVLTVGSLAFSQAPASPGGASYIDEHAVAGPRRPSPFTRSGPGIVGKVKPDVVHYGGDIAYSSASGARSADLGLSVVSLDFEPSGRIFRAASGTSFAAPRVANLAAKLRARYPAASANLIRCLLGLSCDHPAEARELFDSDEDCFAVLGNGLPNAGRAAESEPGRAVMVHEGRIVPDSAVVHPFPVPQEFAIGKAERSIAIAIAYDPPVRWQRGDYLAGQVEIGLYRNVDPQQLADQLSDREAGDLPRNRRWRGGELRPTHTLTAGSTLVTRRWDFESATALNPDDGATYCVSVVHKSAPWAAGLSDPYPVQRYALAVEIWDRERLLNLYQLVQQALQARQRERATIAAS